MNKARLYIFLVAALSVLSPATYAYVVVGSGLTYRFLGDSLTYKTYEVKLTVYEECISGPDNTAYLAIRKGAHPFNLVKIDSAFYATLDTPVAVTTCPSYAAQICILKRTFIFRCALPPDADGYVLSHQRCCRKNAVMNITNPGNNGFTTTCYIPPSGTAAHNSSAVFTNDPPLVVQLGTPLSFDLSATDADGDSLSYGFAPALLGATDSDIEPYPPSGPPFDTVDYVAGGYSWQHPMSASTPTHINPVTGLLTGTPNKIDCYLFGVYCHEWRAGVLVNTTFREFNVIVRDCTLSVPTTSQDELTLFPNPVADQLSVATTGIGPNRISITNVIGQALYIAEFRESNLTVNVSTLPPGIYFLRVNDATVRKFLKL